MALTIVQQKTFAVLADSVAPAFDSNVTAGNLLVALFSSFQGVGTPSVTGGGTWAFADAHDDGGNNQVEGWAAPNATGGATTVTINLPGAGAAITGSILEISGAPTSSPVAQTNSAASPSTTSVSSGAITTTQAVTLLLAAMTHDGVSLSITPDTGAGWTEDYDQENNDTLQCFNGVHIPKSATGTYSHTWTIGSAVNGLGIIFAIKEDSGGGATLTPAPATIAFTAPNATVVPGETTRAAGVNSITLTAPTATIQATISLAAGVNAITFVAPTATVAGTLQTLAAGVASFAFTAPPATLLATVPPDPDIVRRGGGILGAGLRDGVIAAAGGRGATVTPGTTRRAN